MGKRFKKNFKSIYCWKKTSADSAVEDDAKNRKFAVDEAPEVKKQTRPRKLSKEEDLLQRIAELDLHLTKTIKDLYAKLDHQTKLNAEILSKYLVRADDDGGDGKGPLDDEELRFIQDAASIHVYQGFKKPRKNRKAVETVNDTRSEGAGCGIFETNNRKAVSSGSDELRLQDGPDGPQSDVSVTSSCTGSDMPFTSDNVSPHAGAEGSHDGRSRSHAIGTQTDMIDTTSDTADLAVSCKAPRSDLEDNDVPVTDAFAKKGSSMGNVKLPTKYSLYKEWNLTPFKNYCKRVSPVDRVPLLEGESLYTPVLSRPRVKSRLSKLRLTLPTVLSNTDTQKSTTDKLSRLQMSTPVLWSNEIVNTCKSTTPMVWSNKIADPRIDIQRPIEPKWCSMKAEQTPIEVECFGKPIPDSGILAFTPLEAPFTEKGKADVNRVDFLPTAQSVPGQYYTGTVAISNQTKEPISKDLYAMTHDSTNIEALKLITLCKKLFFKERIQYVRGTEPGSDRLKLSNLALMYINAAYRHLNAGVHQRREEHTLYRPPRQVERTGEYADVLPLREICRQLFGIDNVVKHESSNRYFNINCGQDLHTDLNNHSVVVQERYQADTMSGGYCQRSKSADVRGYFGAVVERTQGWKPKWVEFTDDPITELVQLRTSFPDFGHTTLIDVTPPRFTVAVNLRDLMERYVNRRVFKESHIRFLFFNVLKGLEFLHTQGKTHGSIFPNKVLFNSAGYPTLMPNIESSRPRIPPRIEYASPEEITSGHITMATDIFQTALMMSWIMYGKSPYKGASYTETKENLLNESYTPKFVCGTLSRDGRNFLRKCLRTDPGARFKLSKCKKPLENALKWFKMFKGEELASQNFPSPFKDLVLLNT